MSRNKNIRAFWQLAAIFFIGAGVFLVAGHASAQLQLLGKAVGLDCEWKLGETFGLGAFTQLAINALKLIWGILGSLALVMFVWGGFLWLTARGEEQQIKQGWDTLINAVIGLVIVLGSWVIINTIVLSLTSTGSWDDGKLFGGTAWTELVKGEVCVSIKPRTLGNVPGSEPYALDACCGTLQDGTNVEEGVTDKAECEKMKLSVTSSGSSLKTLHYCPQDSSAKINVVSLCNKKRSSGFTGCQNFSAAAGGVPVEDRTTGMCCANWKVGGVDSGYVVNSTLGGCKELKAVSERNGAVVTDLWHCKLPSGIEEFDICGTRRDSTNDDSPWNSKKNCYGITNIKNSGSLPIDTTPSPID